MLNISKAAMCAAALSLSSIPAIGIGSALAQNDPQAGSASVPTVEAVDSSMDEDAIRDVLTGGFAKHVDELKALSATSITIPEISFKLPTADKPATLTTVTLHDVELDNVEKGLAETVTIGSLDTVSDKSKAHFGEASGSNVDMASLLAYYAPPAGTPDTTFKTLYSSYNIEGGTLTFDGGSCKLGAISAGELSARPLQVSIGEMIGAVNKLSAAKDDAVPSDALVTYVRFLTDALTSFRTSASSIDGLSCKDNGKDGKFDFSIGDVNVDPWQEGVYPAVQFSDIKVSDGGENSFSLDAAALKSTDLNPTFEAIKAEGDKVSADWFAANYRKLVPAFGGFSFSGLSFDVPDPEASGSRLKADIDSFDLTLGDYINGVPSHISTSASGVDVPLPKDSTDDNIKMLKALGINRVNMGFTFDAAWDRDSQTVKIDNISVSGKDLGSAAVVLLLGKAGEQLFDTDMAKQEAAAMGLTIKDIGINVTDDGMGDKLIPMFAQQQGQSDPEAFRRQIAGTAEGAVLAFLGSTDEARDLGKAVADFITGDAKAIHIDIAAKSEDGIASNELMQASSNPTTLLNAVTITGHSD